MKNVIYKIGTSINNKIYIGSAINFSKRKAQHKFHLINKSHHSRKLQNHVNKYGYDCLFFEILEYDCEYLLEREQFYMDKLKPFFNILKVAGSNLGCKRTDSQKEYMVSQRMKKSGYKKGWKHSEESIEKLKLSKLKSTYKISEETKKKISEKTKGRIIPDEVRLKTSNTMKGRVFSEEHRKNLSIKAKGNQNGKKK